MIRLKYIFLLSVKIILLSSPFVLGQQSADMLKHEAEKHMQAGRYGEAINMLNELITLYPETADAYIMRGECYEKRSQYKLAVEDLIKANNLRPNNKEISEYLSKLKKLWNSELTNNIEKLEKELTLNPKLYNNYLALSGLYAELKDKEKAKKLYKQYMDLVELSPEIVLRYGDFLANNDELKEGDSSFEKYTEQFPENESIKSKYGYFNLWLGNFKKAETIFSEILRKDPNLKEAQNGYKQAKAKGYFNPSEKEGGEINVAGPTNISGSKIEQYRKILSDNPGNYKVRLSMIDELIKSGRLEESFDQLQIILKDTIRIPTFSTYRTSLGERRDSILNSIISNLKQQVESNPNQKGIMSKLAYYYSIKEDYKNAMELLYNYLNQPAGNDADDLRFQYAQYASWEGEYDKSLKNLDYLLTIEPDNLKYQLLKGEILVWTNKNPDAAEKYLQNNIKAGNQSSEIILALATLYIQNNQFSKADSFIKWANTIDPKSKDVIKVEELYDNHKKLLNEQRIYSLIEEGRKFAREGDCNNALIKFDEYFVQVKSPSESELLEYADLFNCTKNLDKAIEVYDRILSKNSDNYMVRKLRAKDLLWNKNYTASLTEFQKLTIENPDDYECQVLLGAVYQNMGKYSMASSIYSDILKKSPDKQITKMVNDQMVYMPQTGFNGLFSNFPRPIGFTPSVIYYSDNQDFSFK